MEVDIVPGLPGLPLPPDKVETAYKGDGADGALYSQQVTGRMVWANFVVYSLIPPFLGWKVIEVNG